MSSNAQKNNARQKRKIRIRKIISGAPDCPRLNVFKSSRHIYAQLIDDKSGITLAAASTLSQDVKEGLKHTGNLEAAVRVGSAIAKKAKEKGIERVVFDRGGFLYHGRIKALADAARENGLSF